MCKESFEVVSYCLNTHHHTTYIITFTSFTLVPDLFSCVKLTGLSYFLVSICPSTAKLLCKSIIDYLSSNIVLFKRTSKSQRCSSFISNLRRMNMILEFGQGFCFSHLYQNVFSFDLISYQGPGPWQSMVATIYTLKIFADRSNIENCCECRGSCHSIHA